ncbi:MAG: biotin synthase BioB [Planctomycetes bacterium]|nr:biotin synthase BioB [Planctomycetota bacterium]
MNILITEYANIILVGGLLDRAQIDSLSVESEDAFWDLLYWSNVIREKFFGNKIRVCSIVPGRLGGCDQDCAFCSQSIKYDTATEKKAQTISDEQILSAAADAANNGVPFIGIVNSGRAPSTNEFARLEKLIAKIKSDYGIGVCASLGILTAEQMQKLAAAGLDRYNHNLETSERYYGKIVTTHKYADRVNTVKAAKQADLGVCCGGLFGIGETHADRIDMAMALRELEIDMVPMNFLHPIEGTPLADSEEIPPKEILRIIALYRFILPKAHLKAAGGRVLNLRDMQSWIFPAGVTSILTGNYLTTAGRAVQEDMQMLKDMGLEAISN